MFAETSFQSRNRPSATAESKYENIRPLLSHRDRILVENRFACERLRAVRYAISSLYMMSLMGHTMWVWTHYFYQHFAPNGTSSNISERTINAVFFAKRSVFFVQRSVFFAKRFVFFVRRFVFFAQRSVFFVQRFVFFVQRSVFFAQRSAKFAQRFVFLLQRINHFISILFKT